MGEVYENITLKNSNDLGNAMRGIIGESQIHQVDVRAMVDTGTMTLVISEELQEQLGLLILEENKYVSLADQTKVPCKLSEPVLIYWKDRSTTVKATVLSECKEVLLGVIPLEDMDLIVDPKNQKLVGKHGDQVIHRV